MQASLLATNGERSLYDSLDMWILCPRLFKNKTLKEITVSPTVRTPKLVVMDIFGPPLKTNDRKKFVIIINDVCSKLTKAITTVKSMATQIVIISLDHSVIQYGVPSNLLTNNRLQLAAKIFTTLRSFLRLKKLLTTVYRHQTKGQIELFKRTIVARV